MMKGKQTIFSAIFVLLIPLLIFGKDFSGNTAPSSSDRSTLLGMLKFGEAEQDTAFRYVKSPGKAFIFSAILPGAGELYSGAKWRALIFGGIELSSWAVYSSKKKKGERLEKDFIKFADEKWTLYDWFQAEISNDFNSFDGSHHIWVTYEDIEYPVDKDFKSSMSDDTLDYLDLTRDGKMQPVESKEFYENIGKYDQFSGGWKDFKDHNVKPDTVVMTPIRDDYLNQRLESNDALKMATSFVSVIMFNHLISAFDAIIAAKNYSSKEEKDFSWHIGLVTDYTFRNPIRGIRLNVAF